jgi:hypothetical protein
MRTAESKSAAKIRLPQLEVEILEKGTARLEAGKVMVACMKLMKIIFDADSAPMRIQRRQQNDAHESAAG